MKRNARQHGFSLLETLLAVSTLAIGMIFVGGTFLAGIYLATVSTERTIATVATDEALAKIRLYGLDLDDPNLLTADGFVLYEELHSFPSEEMLYPSTDANSVRQYSWAALCRRMDTQSRLVQIAVFVSRQAGSNARYWTTASGADQTGFEQNTLPRPVRINVVQDANAPDDELTIEDTDSGDDVEEHKFVSDGATIMDDETGQIYRVLERYVEPSDRIRLDRPWAGRPLGSSDGGWVWVVPRPVAGGRSPFVAVYQEVLRF
jgi:Tfp pilus assembly protein PilV